MTVTTEEIIKMAIQAGFDEHHAKFDTRMEAFAKLVAAKEREACAKAVDEMHLYGFAAVREFEIATLQDAAKAIRARGEA